MEELALALLTFHFQNQYKVIKTETPETTPKKHSISRTEIHTLRATFSSKRLTGADWFILIT
jgi:hypothetical protein